MEITDPSWDLHLTSRFGSFRPGFPGLSIACLTALLGLLVASMMGPASTCSINIGISITNVEGGLSCWPPLQSRRHHMPDNLLVATDITHKTKERRPVADQPQWLFMRQGAQQRDSYQRQAELRWSRTSLHKRKPSSHVSISASSVQDIDSL